VLHKKLGAIYGAKNYNSFLFRNYVILLEKNGVGYGTIQILKVLMLLSGTFQGDEQLKALKQKNALIESMLQIIQKDKELSKKFDALISIKGIGELTAVILLHLFLRYPNANQRQIVSLVGLDPIIRESGISVKGKSKISKAGDKIYRAALFMPAMVIVKYDKRFKTYYEKLKNNGKHTTVAQVAVMRKLLIVAHAIFKSGEMYKS